MLNTTLIGLSLNYYTKKSPLFTLTHSHGINIFNGYFSHFTSSSLTSFTKSHFGISGSTFEHFLAPPIYLHGEHCSEITTNNITNDNNYLTTSNFRYVCAICIYVDSYTYDNSPFEIFSCTFQNCRGPIVPQLGAACILYSESSYLLMDSCNIYNCTVKESETPCIFINNSLGNVKLINIVIEDFYHTDGVTNVAGIFYLFINTTISIINSLFVVQSQSSSVNIDSISSYFISAQSCTVSFTGFQLSLPSSIVPTSNQNALNFIGCHSIFISKSVIQGYNESSAIAVKGDNVFFRLIQSCFVQSTVDLINSVGSNIFIASSDIVTPDECPIDKEAWNIVQTSSPLTKKEKKYALATFIVFMSLFIITFVILIVFVSYAAIKSTGNENGLEVQGFDEESLLQKDESNSLQKENELSSIQESEKEPSEHEEPTKVEKKDSSEKDSSEKDSSEHSQNEEIKEKKVRF